MRIGVADIAVVIDEKQRKLALGDELRSCFVAGVEDAVHEALEVVRVESRPQLAGQRQAVDEGMSSFATARVLSHLVHEVLVHDDLAAMRVEVALGELDRLAEHDPHVDLGDGEEGELLEGLSDEVAVLYEGLEG